MKLSISNIIKESSFEEVSKFLPANFFAIYFKKPKLTPNINKKSNETNEFTKIENINQIYICAGNDESGKSDSFGSITVSVCFLKSKEIKEELIKRGVKDSKKIDDAKIPKLAREIKKILANQFTSYSIRPEIYNKFYQRFGNIDKVLVYFHLVVWGQLNSKLSSSITKNIFDSSPKIIDSFVNKDIFLKYWNDFSKKIKKINFLTIYPIIHFDQFLIQKILNLYQKRMKNTVVRQLHLF
ncbi:hypothetical protein [Mycoplasmoides fastidiosum]|uniref:hypothetical protein n=1 Tax=Mycoplasmoides fastidiosum TaxID=92758 RepID=UPI00211447D6|nr:hypothetical protein [Mycoplasmoides fastidiosum]UUD38097.1 hypothetical protein NPA10_01790 [Mycoplasmoides fastidiosum]